MARTNADIARMRDEMTLLTKLDEGNARPSFVQGDRNQAESYPSPNAPDTGRSLSEATSDAR